MEINKSKLENMLYLVKASHCLLNHCITADPAIVFIVNTSAS